MNDPGSESRGAVAGVVMLSKPVSQTGPFRGIVEKLFVAPSWRRKGVAKLLMRKLEEVARRDGRTMLVSSGLSAKRGRGDKLTAGAVT